MSDQEQATSNFKGKGKEQTSSNINNMTSSIGAMSGKSRKPPPLHRNNACLPCKKRKRKCDAMKPVCGPCGNSARLYQEDPQCEWAPTIPIQSQSASASTSTSTLIGLKSATPEVKKELTSSELSTSTTLHQQRRPLSASISRILDSPTEGLINNSGTSSIPAAANSAVPSSITTSTALFSHNLPSPIQQQLQHQQSSGDNHAATSLGSNNSITSATARRKNLKRDNESAQVETLQARIAELEGQLKSALLEVGGGGAGNKVVKDDRDSALSSIIPSSQAQAPIPVPAASSSHASITSTGIGHPPSIDVLGYSKSTTFPTYAPSNEDVSSSGIGGGMTRDAIGPGPVNIPPSSNTTSPMPTPPTASASASGAVYHGHNHTQHHQQPHHQRSATAAHIALPPSPVSSGRSASHGANTGRDANSHSQLHSHPQYQHHHYHHDAESQQIPYQEPFAQDVQFTQSNQAQQPQLQPRQLQKPIYDGDINATLQSSTTSNTTTSSSMYAIPAQQYLEQQEREYGIAQSQVYRDGPKALPQQMQFLQGGKIVPSGAWNITPTSSNSNSPAGGHLLWTQWPADLPHLDIVKALAGTALAMLSDTLFLLPADSVFRSLALPPTDPRFPSIALLHALCAIGATACPLPPEARGYWQSQDAPNPSTYHFRAAKKHLQTFNVAQILDDTRAGILLTVYSFAAEQFIDVWQLVGMVCRSMAPTGLNHIQNNNALPSTKMSITPGHFLRKPTFLPPPSDDYDVFYRSTTLYWAFSCDVWMGACSGWAMALDIQDISTLLPVWPSDTTPLDIVLNQPSLDPHSPLFFNSHLDSPMLSLHLSIKAMVLFRRVVDFLQRSTAPDCIITTDAKHQIRSTPAFQALTDTLLGFQQNFPPKAKYPLQTLPSGKLDANLLNAHFVPCTALLLLYEPFILGTDEDEGFHKISMTAANQILQMTDLIYAHSKDSVSMYYTQINYSWMVCNRTLIRAMRFREDLNDFERAKGLRASVEFLLARNATLASRSPLVGSCLGMIENLVKDESPWHRM